MVHEGTELCLRGLGEHMARERVFGSIGLVHVFEPCLPVTQLWAKIHLEIQTALGKSEHSQANPELLGLERGQCKSKRDCRTEEVPPQRSISLALMIDGIGMHPSRSAGSGPWRGLRTTQGQDELWRRACDAGAPSDLIPPRHPSSQIGPRSSRDKPLSDLRLH